MEDNTMNELTGQSKEGVRWSIFTEFYSSYGLKSLKQFYYGSKGISGIDSVVWGLAISMLR